MIQAILREIKYCEKKVGALYDHFLDMGDPVKTQVENRMDDNFNFWGHKFNRHNDRKVFRA